jgi:adenylate kinase family enzyme
LFRFVDKDQTVPIGKRILVAGNSGSGKTTLAAALAARLRRPLIDLDGLYWQLPDWQDPDPEEFQARVRDALGAAPDGWVVAGNYWGRLRHITWVAADTVVWLDLPLRVSLWRILKRSWRRSRSNELLWGTNYERFWPQLKVWSPRESLIAFSVKGHRAKRRQFEEGMARSRTQIHWHRLRSQREVEAFLAGLAEG